MMRSVIVVLERINDFLKVVEEWVASLVIVAICVSTGLGVFWRYVLRNPLSWPNELSMFLFLYAVFLSASLVSREDGHFKVGFFVESRSPRTQHIINIFLNILKLTFLIVFIYTSIQVFPRQSMRRMTAVLGVHKGWHTFSLTVGFSFMALTVFTNTLQRIAELMGIHANIARSELPGGRADV